MIRILAVDDSPTLRQFITRSLREHIAGYEVITAQDGEEGVALAGTEAPDLILLDFVLPGMKGDDVCRELEKSSTTRNIPVVLMSSNTSDIQRTAQECANVIKSISKPFTPELLCATVGSVVRELKERKPVVARSSRAEPPPTASESEEATPAAMAPPNSTWLGDAPKPTGFRGHTGTFSLYNALLGIELDELTGVLFIFSGTKPLQLHVDKGRAVVVGTQDVAAYLGKDLVLTPGFVQEQQAATGCPAPLILAARGVLAPDEALEKCRAVGLRLMAPIWTRLNTVFEFLPMAALPEWSAGIPAFEGGMSEWALESLREVGEDSSSAHAWGEGTGVPAYTRRGYERIQHIPLNDEEVGLASLVDSHRSIAQIAAQLGMPREYAERILFRFMCLEIFDHWPATILRQV